MCVNDCHLRGSYDGLTYFYPTTLSNDNITKYDSIICADIDYNNCSYEISSPTNNSGTIGMWFYLKSNITYDQIGKYCFFTRWDINKESLFSLEYNCGFIVLGLNSPYYNGNRNILSRGYSNIENKWNFISISWCTETIENKHYFDYKIKLNEDVIEGEVETTSLIEFNDNTYTIGRINSYIISPSYNKLY